MRVSPISLLCLAAAGILAPPAFAQDAVPFGGGPAYGSGPPETVEVIAPRIRGDSSRLNGPLERVTLRSSVPYGDLDLRTRWGANELRRRVYLEAHNVCNTLAVVFPVHTMTTAPRCLPVAIDTGLVRARSTIVSNRIDYWHGVATY